ncbi:hypothetical protein ACN38_g8739 [Penicillium nordicum]|uniref:Uncharacterized protein n=1 Tax=Penicillium nordicum TaxID=229535 RepID=A0A0M8NWP9_9EURO|nr:hypothetical protein ACN38_g8739 [Penicillium nordicum]
MMDDRLIYIYTHVLSFSFPFPFFHSTTYFSIQVIHSFGLNSNIGLQIRKVERTHNKYGVGPEILYAV